MRTPDLILKSAVVSKAYLRARAVGLSRNSLPGEFLPPHYREEPYLVSDLVYSLELTREDAAQVDLRPPYKDPTEETKSFQGSLQMVPAASGSRRTGADALQVMGQCF